MSDVFFTFLNTFCHCTLWVAPPLTNHIVYHITYHAVHFCRFFIFEQILRFEYSTQKPFRNSPERTVFPMF